MRVLFTYAGGSGHADPLVPIADAVRAAGHDVTFFGRRSAATVLDAHGFPLVADPDDPVLPPEITPLLAFDPEHEQRVLREGFAGRAGRARADGAVQLIRDLRPDLLVCDEADFGCMVAAEAAGLPHATVLSNAAGSFVRADLVAEALDGLRTARGLPSDPGATMPSRYLVISPFPSSFRDPSFPLPEGAISIRPGLGHTAAGERPAWLTTRSSTPTIYATLGTIFNRESGDLFDRVLAGLRDLSARIVVTVGRDLDPARFGPQPDNVHIERYLSQSAVLPACDLVINHGGSGSVIGALAHGLPLVVLPMGADQMTNAERCERLGVGVVLDAVRADPGAIRRAVVELLDDPSARAAAGRIRDEVEGLPEAAAVVPRLEQLVE